MKKEEFDQMYPYANSRAAQWLSDAINDKSGEESLRQMAGKLKYRSAVVLSHMRTGRLPIPVDRADEIAQVVGIDTAKFLVAVLEQRYPDVDIRRAFLDEPPAAVGSVSPSVQRLANELAEIAGCSISELPAEHISVMREVVAARHPRDRWLGQSEVRVVDIVRKARPEWARDGITDAQANAFEEALSIVK